MSESNERKSEASPGDAGETQRQRWAKYGVNVAVSSIVVVCLAAVAVYFTHRSHFKPIDTTIGNVYSLKPQTVNILNDLKQKVKLVSVYQSVKPQAIAGGSADDDDQTRTADDVNRPEMVRDLLEEYRRRSKNVDVEVIDKVADAAKVEALIDEVKQRYGGREAAFREYLQKDFPSSYAEINAFVAGELPKLKQQLAQIEDGSVYFSISFIGAALADIPDALADAKAANDKTLKEPLPNYKGAVDKVKTRMSDISSQLGDLATGFADHKNDKNLPEGLRQYMAGSIDAYNRAKKIADEQVEKMNKLGSVEKLDELRRSLRTEQGRPGSDEKPQDAILVMGENDMRVLWGSQLWSEADKRDVMNGQARPRFRGEQQVSGAILSVTSKKPMRVVFVRPGGPPLLGGMDPSGGGSQYAALAQAMHDKNIEVLEKDASRWMGQQRDADPMAAAQDATDEQMKDAVWVVLPSGGMMGPGPIGEKLSDHLKSGGSALVLTQPTADSMSQALSPYGIDIRADAMIVHRSIPVPAGRNTGQWEDLARAVPFLFIMESYGDHPLTKPLQSLDYCAVQMCVVRTSGNAKPLLPAPDSMKPWGETDFESLRTMNIAYNPDKGDAGMPLHGGAASEGANGSRVVAIPFLTIYPEVAQAVDPAQRGVLRFPGNQELFFNSLYWLSKNETMIAISPSAMEVSRIEPISKPALRVWQVAMVACLPLLVVAAGMLVYVARRD